MYFGKRIRVGIFCVFLSLFVHINNLYFQNPNKTDMSEACFSDHHLLFSATVRGPLRTPRHSIQTCFIYIHLFVHPSIRPFVSSYSICNGKKYGFTGFVAFYVSQWNHMNMSVNACNEVPYIFYLYYCLIVILWNSIALVREER